MTLAELIEGFAVLRRKLADWVESDTVKEMQREKDNSAILDVLVRVLGR